MAKDLFYFKEPNPENPYQYDISEYQKIDSGLFCYVEVLQIKPATDYLLGITVDDKNNLYVSGTKKIFIYDADKNLINKIDLDEDAYCLTVSESGKIYLGMADHIEVWSQTGELLQSWPSMGEEAIFTSVAVNETSVFVADAGHKVVYHFNHNGELQNRIGEKKPEKEIKGFFIPSPYFDLLLGRNNELWVVNPGYHRFESYRSNGELISSWEKTSMLLDGFSGCCNPSHIAMLSDGSFVTSEKGLERIKIHRPTGEFKCVVAGPEQFIEGTTDLDLAVDSENRIYVSDTEKGMVRIFDQMNKEL